MTFSIFISCPRGLEYLLEDEARALGLTISRVSPQGVFGEACLEIVYKICMWSRIANRVQLILFSGEALNQKMIYNLCHSYDWLSVFDVEKTIAVEFHGESEEINNSMFGAQLVKDAVVDVFREQTNTRPIIDKNNPEVLIHAYLNKDTLTVSLDMTGYSLHQRGYRAEKGLAPIKENVAAAMLMRAKWPSLLEKDYNLYDPFCGSGTIVIEAALMAANIAPGLLRNDQSFIHWLQHDETLWDKICRDAMQEVKKPGDRVKFRGSDIDKRAIQMAKSCAEFAGVSDWIEWEVLDFTNNTQVPDFNGLLICNPPYGERLGDEKQLELLYQQMGQQFHSNFQGWQAYVLTSNQTLARSIGLRATKQYTLYNGALECKLYYFELNSTNQYRTFDSSYKLSQNAEMFANRLKKNYQHIKKWAKRNNISCYRVYDADLPEYSYAIDIYNDHVVLQEYKAPSSIPEHQAEKRSIDVINITPTVLGISPKNISHKQRKKQKGDLQYKKIAEKNHYLNISEGNARFNVNLNDYLDTGIFLDHRLLRLKFAELNPGVKFLNCFCYTGTASVHAALAGAITTNVDLSNTYLNWATDNFKLNSLDYSKHQFIQFDCLEWLKITKDRFDVIFLDPPSFSNSKRMSETLDIQRDHEELIKSAMKLLNTDGVLYFSTNLRQFKLSPNIANQYNLIDISKETIDLDFKRNQKIHQCFLVSNYDSPIKK
ncbi:MAG: bifunctional 23S rRNA (guanine(2069)-N(7))-methyltransferase RlmK/23S rRNA (guanine(2445)-N(2))-methyltransferase RlmL [Legionellaceae bacterium]|nr:bifunctional 23S rRNA (guanine(2069)-N(7))-methyltransferase RlmK/23S rRNA (guanine(2445)-N(2))-methyltransferase RlmL [Legionellaceae bacterium]